MYRLIRPFLFAFDAERSHRLSLRTLRALHRFPGGAALLSRLYSAPPLSFEVMGLRFPNPVGLAAGLDKNGAYVAALARLGFGWIEVGTVTPRAQSGNPRPRLFRLPRHHAIINRMGFNNDGAAALIANLERQARPAVLGINIGKNKSTPIEQAVDDYVAAWRTVAAHADYIAVNISSPNTADLRRLQEAAALDALLSALKEEQAQTRRTSGRYVPIAVKIAPDLVTTEIFALAQTLIRHGVDAAIATNTTISRPALYGDARANEAGGLSGRPLRPLATRTVADLRAALDGKIPIIGVGGIDSTESAWERMIQGADLIQIYSGLIFAGPTIVRDIVRGLALKLGNTDALATLRRERLNLSSGSWPNP